MEGKIEEFRQIYENLNDFGKEKMTEMMEKYLKSDKGEAYGKERNVRTGNQYVVNFDCRIDE